MTKCSSNLVSQMEAIYHRKRCFQEISYIQNLGSTSCPTCPDAFLPFIRTSLHICCLYHSIEVDFTSPNHLRELSRYTRSATMSKEGDSYRELAINDQASLLTGRRKTMRSVQDPNDTDFTVGIASSKTRKRQRSRSRDRVRMDLWERDSATSLPTCRNALSPHGLLHNNIDLKNSSQRSAEPNKMQDSCLCVERINKSVCTGQAVDEYDRNTWYRLAYLELRGWDDELMRAMDASVYDENDEYDVSFATNFSACDLDSSLLTPIENNRTTRADACLGSKLGVVA